MAPAASRVLAIADVSEAEGALRPTARSLSANSYRAKRPIGGVLTGIDDSKPLSDAIFAEIEDLFYRAYRQPLADGLSVRT